MRPGLIERIGPKSPRVMERHGRGQKVSNFLRSGPHCRVNTAFREFVTR